MYREAGRINPVAKSPLYPVVLRTNKMVYNEALPLLYSKNAFEVVCVQQQISKGNTGMMKT